ncbi:MAG TPA: RagB/SusD family nutrient uptake outer membrane protein [Longimicrobiales bacterium]
MNRIVSQSGRGAALCLLVTTTLAACGELTSLKQDAPSRVLANDLFQPQNASLLVDGAVGDFECSLGNYIVATGLVGDELIDAQLSQAMWDYDRRSVFSADPIYGTTACGGTQAIGLYTPLSVARFQADQAVKYLNTWTDQQVANRTDLIATASAYAGYSLVLMAEAMCSAAIDLGPELSRAQLAAEAEKRFTAAIAAATTAKDNNVLNLARVGRARARLEQGNLAGAASDAAAVPDGFVFNATYGATPTRRENRVYTQLFRDNFASVDPTFRAVTWAGAADPRVSVINGNAIGADRSTAIWRANKYPTISTPIPIARWAEAQLIVAEADAASGDLNGAVAIINTLHQRAGIAPYAGGSAAEVKAQVAEERRRELFLEGQRLGDIIRNNVQLAPAAGSAFPKGGLYGTQLCMPLPDIERNNNPNISKS